MNTRIKQLRNSLGLSQAEFAAKISIGQTGVSSIERGNSIVTDRTIHQIVSVFGVDEHWLRTGDGDMYALPSEEDAELIELLARLNADDMYIDRKRLAISFCRLVMELPRPALTPAADLCNQLADALKQKKDED